MNERKRQPGKAPSMGPAKKREALAKLSDAIPAGWLDALIAINQDIIGSKTKAPPFHERGELTFLIDPILREADEFTAEVAELAARILPKGRLKPDSKFTIEIPAQGYNRTLTTRELFQELKDNWREFSFSYLAETWTAAEVEPDTIRPSRHALEDALIALMEVDGILHGPCPECGRSGWVTEYRPRKSPGRPPLEYTFCPQCATRIQREKARQRLKKHRDKGSLNA